MIPMQLLVNLDVDDLDKAICFYETALGLTLGRRFGAGGAEMLASPVPIYLLVKAAGTAASGAASQLRSYDRQAGHIVRIESDFNRGARQRLSFAATRW